MDAAGWVPLPALLRRLQSPGATEAVVRQIVAADAKGRFVLDGATTPHRIRAAQGYSVPLAEPELQRVADAAAVPCAVHITSEDGWRAIQACWGWGWGCLPCGGRRQRSRPPRPAKPCPCLTWPGAPCRTQESGELRRMSRTHIHFATEGRHLRRNRWAQVLLRLDVAATLAGGHELALAANGVLLAEGPVPVAFVRRIERAELPQGWG